MKKYKTINSLLTALLLGFGFSVTAYANSSWVWITESRPYDVLPFVIIGTLIIETVATDRFSKIGNMMKTFSAVLIGNLLSFVAPYIIYANFTTPYCDADYGLQYILDRCPYYTVGSVFLIMTVLIELPVSFLFLRKSCQSKKKLAFIIVTVNIITTALVAITERLLCRGHW